MKKKKLSRVAMFVFCFFIFSTTSIATEKISYKMNICGESMRPLWNQDTHCSIHRVQSLTREEAKVNDLICFNPRWDYFQNINSNDYRYVCHRIIEMNETHILTKGDANQDQDYWMKKSNIALKVLGEW